MRLVVSVGPPESFGLPTESVLILLQVDQLTDMGRTSVNALNNCIAVAVTKWECQVEQLAL